MTDPSPIDPAFTFALWKFDLITDEQAEEEYDLWEEANKQYQQEWALSKEAWSELPWRDRFWKDSISWRLDWMERQRL